jgi:hypothetical protein
VAVNDFLDALAPWAYFVTFTHRFAVSLDECEATLQRWAERLTAELHEHLHLLWCVEEGGRFGRVHCHAPVAPWRCSFPINSTLLVRLWTDEPTAGHDNDVRVYIPRDGAAGYIAKGERWSYGVLCPRLRDCRRRCLAGPRPFPRRGH